MEVKEINRDGLLRKYSITVSPEETKTALNEAAQGIAGETIMPGFRAGKVPLSMIKIRFASNLRNDVMEKFIKLGINQLLENYHKDSPMINIPTLTSQTFSESEGIAFELECEVFPQLPQIDLSQVKLKKYITDCSDEVLNQEIAALQAAHPKMQPLENVQISKEHMVLAEWELHLLEEDKRIDGNLDYFDIGKPSRIGILDFTNHLIGCSVEEQKQFDIELPQDSSLEDYAGKTVRCRVKIKGIFENVHNSPAELSTYFGFPDLQSFKILLKGLLTTRISSCSREMLEHDLLQYINNLLGDIEMPKRLFEERINHMKIPINTEPDSIIENNARQDLKTSIFLGYIALRENIDATNAEIIEYFKHQPEKGKARSPKDITNKEAEDIRVRLITIKVIDYLLSKAEVQETHVPFEEFCNLYKKSFS